MNSSLTSTADKGAADATSQTLSSTPLVVVLMSTYNGERYVEEQLASILEQLPPGGRVLVRDDGSSDGTPERIATLDEPHIQLLCGTNLGFGRSFLTLLTLAPADADMVMFADQDDVWLPDKIDRAWRHLQAAGNVPALYGSAQLLVDQDLKPLHATPAWPRGPSLAGALIENLITGCTAALNRPALHLLQRAGVPPEVRFHDWWVYLVVSAFGTVIHDREPTLLYRQHASNQIGHGAGWIGRQRQMVRFLLRNDWVGILLAQVSALMKHYGAHLPLETRELMLAHFHFGDEGAVPRWRLIFSPRRWRQHAVDEVALRILLALHRLHLWPLPHRRLGSSLQSRTR